MLTMPVLMLTLGLAPSQAGQLNLSNDRLTYGPLGIVRADDKYLPGDTLFLSFDIDNLKFDASGKGSYSVGMEVTDSKGERVVRQEPRTQQAFNYLGGKSLPGLAVAQVGLEQAAGQYTMKVTVTDEAAKASKTLERKFQVLPAGFGLVQVGLSVDPDGMIPTLPVRPVGESVFLNFAAAGFTRDAKKQPDLAVEMRVLDAQNNPTFGKAITGEAKGGIDEKLKLVPMQFGLSLNRAGKYTITIKATDRLGNKTATIALPITVVDVK